MQFGKDLMNPVEGFAMTVVVPVNQDVGLTVHYNGVHRYGSDIDSYVVRVLSLLMHLVFFHISRDFVKKAASGDPDQTVNANVNSVSTMGLVFSPRTS